MTKRWRFPVKGGDHIVRIKVSLDLHQHVDEAVAIGAEDRHVAGRLHQRPLQVVAIGKLADGLAEAGGVADRAACVARREAADDVDGEFPVYADEGGVRRAGKVCDGAVAFAPEDFVLARMNRPDFTGKAHLVALEDDAARLLAAEDGDGPGPDQTVEGTYHAVITLPAAGADRG